MAENRTYPQYMPNMSRLDYLSAMAFNHGHVLVVERACGIEVPERAEYIRVITVELNRIASHLVWFGAFVLDLGGFTPLMYCFEDREQILDMLEAVTGSRLTYCYFRFGGLYNDIDDEFISGTRAFITRMRKELKMYDKLVTGNIILRQTPRRSRPRRPGDVPALRGHRPGCQGFRHQLRCPEKRTLLGLSRI